MTNNQPFLSGFPTQICGSARRRLQDVIAAKRRDLTEASIATYALQFSHILPAHFLHGLSVSKRIRQYCNVVVFWVWLAQILEANASLSKAVSLVQAWCADHGLPVPGKNTSAYSKGRGRQTPGAQLAEGKENRQTPTLGHMEKSAKKPAGSTMTAEEWEALPDELEVRLIRFYFEDRDGKKRLMVLSTTLLDHVKYDWQELAALYAQRWDIELRLRDVKATLGLEHLRVKLPENARKTTRMALIAYNLIKSSCQEAAHSAGKSLRLMSFKGALDTIVANTAR